MNLLYIQITGTTLTILFIVFVLFIMLFSLYKRRSMYRKTDNELDEELAFIPDEALSNSSRDNVIDFNIVNNTDEEMVLELCKLDVNDERYSVNVPLGKYEMLVEYLKTNSYFVNMTRVYYSNEDKKGFGIPSWYKNIISLISYSPFALAKRPVLVACSDIEKEQYQSNIIQVKGTYTFDYFNDLQIKLLPKANMRVALFCSNHNKQFIIQPIQCALSIKNNSTEKQVVELFNREYFEKTLKTNTNISVDSIFEQVTYEEIIYQFEAKPLIATNVKFIAGKENHDSKLKVNLKEYKLSGLISVNQFQSNVIDLPLKDETYIHNMSIEIEPNTEILISIK